MSFDSIGKAGTIILFSWKAKFQYQ